jgi:hypothetical protein
MREKNEMSQATISHLVYGNLKNIGISTHRHADKELFFIWWKQCWEPNANLDFGPGIHIEG